MAKGSIIFKIIIVLLAFLLVAVIAVPEEIWTEEELITKQGRSNMSSIFEAEKFFHGKSEKYTSDLDTLVTVIQNDTSLQQKKKLAELTNKIYDIMEGTLEIPSIQAILTISQSVKEIQGDILGNERYFDKYSELVPRKDEIYMNLTRFDSSAAFPNLCETKSFVDSLNELKNTINQYRLQNSAYHTQNHLDSIATFLPDVEKDAIREFWNNLHQRINLFINDANKTDIKKVTNFVDRLDRFNDRINSSINILQNADFQTDLAHLSDQQNRMSDVYEEYISSEHFQLTQRFGLLELTEVDSMLLLLGKDNFNCPDNEHRYLVDTTNKRITIECPNLLDEFSANNQRIIQPIKDLTLYTHISRIEETIDSTMALMTQTIPLIRRYGNILLNMKEIMAEMKDFSSVEFIQITKNLEELVDTVQTEKKISVLKPLFEEILNPMDTLASRIRTNRVQDLEERLEYLGDKLKQLDSTLSSNEVPSRVRRQIQPFYPTYEAVFSIADDMKRSLSNEMAQKISTASDQLEKSIKEVINGYNERVYVIFNKKHINHGYIKNGLKSWEEQQ